MERVTDAVKHNTCRMCYPWLACVLTLVVCLSRGLQAYTISNIDRNVAHGIMKQIAIDPYTHHKLPVLKMLKRQIRNFRTGRKASLTLVFTSNEPVDVHWFQVARVDGKEMMYPVLEGHPYYELSILQAGDVTATTLVIPLHYHDDDHVFETILTNENATMQYQIRSTLDNKIIYSLDTIDSPEWLVVPPYVSHLTQKQTFQRHCRSFVRMEHGGNALILMHAHPVLPNSSNRSRPEFRKMLQTHDSGQEKHAEELGSMILEGKMHRITYATSRDAAVFDVRAKQPTAERSREGIYMCTVERLSYSETYLDKFHLLSYVTVGRHHSLATILPSKPHVEIVSCATSSFDIPKETVVLVAKQTGCVRCRGYGYPRPKVEILRKYTDSSDRELTLTNPKIAVSKYTNVAEAGIVEAIYVFRDPDPSMIGAHICKAWNGNGGESIFFDIKIRQNRYY